MKTRVFMVLVVLAMAFAIVPVASADGPPGFSPESVDEVLFPGDSVEVQKAVHTPELPPKLDVCLIVDLSGSYWDDLPNIKTGENHVLEAIRSDIKGYRGFGRGGTYRFYGTWRQE